MYDERPPAFVFVAQEKKAPYAIGVYYLDPAAIVIGQRLARRDLNAIAACYESGLWHDFGIEPQQISLPAWANFIPD